MYGYKPTSEQAGKHASTQASARKHGGMNSTEASPSTRARRQASIQAHQHASTRAHEHASTQASTQVHKPASTQVHKPASTQAPKRAHKCTSPQARQHHMCAPARQPAWSPRPPARPPVRAGARAVDAVTLATKAALSCLASRWPRRGSPHRAGVTGQCVGEKGSRNLV